MVFLSCIKNDLLQHVTATISKFVELHETAGVMVFEENATLNYQYIRILDLQAKLASDEMFPF